MDTNTKIVLWSLTTYFVGLIMGVLTCRVNKKLEKRLVEPLPEPEVTKGNIVEPLPEPEVTKGNIVWKDGDPKGEAVFEPNTEGPYNILGYYTPRQQPKVDEYGFASAVDPVKENWIDEAEKKLKAAKEDPSCAGVIIIRKRGHGRMKLMERLIQEHGDQFFDNFSATEQPLPDLTVTNTGKKHLRPEETPEDNL